MELADYFGLKVDVPPPDDDTVYDVHGRRLMPMLAPGGIETRLPLVYSEGVATGRMSRHRWVEVCCSGPARLFDLHRKGELLPGFDADIVIFDPNGEKTYSVGNLHSNTDYTVWEGWKLPGRRRQDIPPGQADCRRRYFSGSNLTKAH
jgi:dihydropyrimidinase